MEGHQNCTMKVEPEVCYISFTDLDHDEVEYNDELETVRGEKFIIELNAKHEVIGIELQKPKIKPCQC